MCPSPPLSVRRHCCSPIKLFLLCFASPSIHRCHIMVLVMVFLFSITLVISYLIIIWSGYWKVREISTSVTLRPSVKYHLLWLPKSVIGRSECISRNCSVISLLKVLTQTLTFVSIFHVVEYYIPQQTVHLECGWLKPAGGRLGCVGLNDFLSLRQKVITAVAYFVTKGIVFHGTLLLLYLADMTNSRLWWGCVRLVLVACPN